MKPLFILIIIGSQLIIRSRERSKNRSMDRSRDASRSPKSRSRLFGYFYVFVFLFSFFNKIFRSKEINFSMKVPANFKVVFISGGGLSPGPIPAEVPMRKNRLLHFI